MYIYSKESFSNDEIIGSKMLLTYLLEDEEKVASLINALEARGIYYSAVGKSDLVCKRNSYISDIEVQIDSSKIAVIVLSKAFFDDCNKELQNITWYEIGYLLGQKKKIALYFIDIDSSDLAEKLYKTPIRQIQGCNNEGDLIKFINANNIMENLFYTDEDINRYASKRISYYKLTTVFNVYKSNILEMTKQLNKFGDDFDSKTILNMFLQELVCGVTVTSFNKKDVLNEMFTPYLSETDIIMKDFPVNFQYSKPELLDYSSAEDIFATIKADFILPVHSLLGVNFKPFIAFRRKSKFKSEFMIHILEKNYNTSDLEKYDVFMKNDDHLQRLYFLLDMGVSDEEDYTIVGKKTNYMFPE
ncbi:MAG: hypothetical protein ACI35W_08330 [Anaeroplasmataceae bacterium]